MAEGFCELVASDAEDEGFEGVEFSEAPGAEGEECGDDGFLGELFDPILGGLSSAEEGFQAGEKVFGEFVFEGGGARLDPLGDGDGAGPRQFLRLSHANDLPTPPGGVLPGLGDEVESY